MFAYSLLRGFLEKLLRHSDVFSFAGAIEAGRVGTPRTTILRHDVDIDVDAAAALAGVEAEYGIRSTFFFLTGCDTYNVAGAASRRQLRQLAEQGFEVALHFDPQLYPELGDDQILPAAQREAEWLSQIAGAPVRSLSLHNPSTHGRYPHFEGFNNAYDPPYFDPDFYLSDSCMGFRGKDPLEFVRRAEQHSLHIVLHPFHYSDAAAAIRSAMPLSSSGSRTDRRDNAGQPDLCSTDARPAPARPRMKLRSRCAWARTRKRKQVHAPFAEQSGVFDLAGRAAGTRSCGPSG